jgi:hypothetical protein
MTAMDIKIKEKSIIMAREIQEATETLDVALTHHSGEHEAIEAKNIVANVLRSYKVFIDQIPEDDRAEVQELFSKKIEAMAKKAKRLG